LTKRDLDLNSCQLVLRETKNGDTAKLPLGPSLCQELQSYCEELQPEDRLFPVSASVWTKSVLGPDRDEAGLPEQDHVGSLDMHAMRHGRLTALAASGCPVHVLQKLARHHSAAFTVQTYLHAQDDDLRKWSQA